MYLSTNAIDPWYRLSPFIDIVVNMIGVSCDNNFGLRCKINLEKKLGDYGISN
jgi:hypothetical protein